MLCFYVIIRSLINGVIVFLKQRLAFGFKSGQAYMSGSLHGGMISNASLWNRASSFLASTFS